MDCTGEQLAFLQDFLSRNPYDDYDRLIQLCDAISLPDGACIVEKRLVDVALRHGVTELSIEKWKAFLQLKKQFDRKWALQHLFPAAGCAGKLIGGLGLTVDKSRTRAKTT